MTPRLGLILGFALAASAFANDSKPTVGIEGKLDVQLAGPELTAKPPDRAAPINLRLASTRPHGTLIQYDLRYIGLVPGRYDLRDYLVRPDGSRPTDLAPLTVEIAGILPAHHNVHLTPSN